MTDWQRVLKLGTHRLGIEYWRQPIIGIRSVTISLGGHWVRVEWEWAW